MWVRSWRVEGGTKYIGLSSTDPIIWIRQVVKSPLIHFRILPMRQNIVKSERLLSPVNTFPHSPWYWLSSKSWKLLYMYGLRTQFLVKFLIGTLKSIQKDEPVGFFLACLAKKLDRSLPLLPRRQNHQNDTLWNPPILQSHSQNEECHPHLELLLDSLGLWLVPFTQET